MSIVRSTKNPFLMVFLLIILALSGCDSPMSKSTIKPLPSGNFPNSPNKPSDALDVEVYIDASASMQGYVKSKQTTGYFDILRVMETSIKTGWDATNLGFYKFGAEIQKLEGRDFQKALLPEFYTGPISFETKIEKVINKKINEREHLLVVVLTDLYQKDNDVSLLVGLLKDICLERGLTVGIAGVRSFFSGKIFDVGLNNQSFTFQSQLGNDETYRPFYLLTIGEYSDVQQFFVNLSKYSAAVKEDNIVLFSPNLADPLMTFAKGQRGKETRNVNEVTGITKEDLRIKQFRVLDDDKPVKVSFSIPYSHARYAPQLDATSFVPDATVLEYKNGIQESLVNTTGKLSAQANLKKGSLSLVLEVAPGVLNEHAKHRAHIVIQPEESAYRLPSFVSAWDLRFPKTIPLDNEKKLMEIGSKTQNLKFFMESLFFSNYRVNKPKLFESYIYFKH
ncbi:MAG: hypothetical protein PF495_16950 [Spirochaetales bacterium]|jgi:hypothetical protein|nr:hypothetical protein [Spirochaetales bacterium]